jgi:hypothetical protein
MGISKTPKVFLKKLKKARTHLRGRFSFLFQRPLHMYYEPPCIQKYVQIQQVTSNEGRQKGGKVALRNRRFSLGQRGDVFVICVVVFLNSPCQETPKYAIQKSRKNVINFLLQ